MLRFHYPLQKIVDLKTNQKTEAEWMLSKAVGRLQAEETSLGNLFSRKSDMQEELYKQSLQRTTISDMLLTQSYIDHLEQEIDRKLKDVVHAQTEVDHNKAKLNEKMLDEKIWNMTKEKALLNFKTQYLKKEQNDLDEMATVRFAKTP